MRRVASILVALSLAAGVAQASSIIVSFTADGSDCDATIAPFAPVNFWILGHTYGDAAVGGITGAEFQMTGFPVGWFATPTAPSSFNTVIGNPLTGGVNIAAATCVAPVGNLITLFSVSGFATSPVGATIFQIERHANPSNPNFLCPLMVLCDAPVYTKICVAGGAAFVNGMPCDFAVTPATWSTVKALYGS